ncbi:MAG: DUF3025 domain-containing protein [Burkholderiaceae bacterium]|nr:DUF3025 domain-containing protein [Burkholderiaceae bacterium]
MAGVSIDWTVPWLALHRAVGEPIGQQVASGVSVVDALNQALAAARLGRQPMSRCFVDQEALPPGEPYEAFIARTSSVPTRNNAHDFFNGLMWLRHRQLKARLNALQVEQLERRSPGDRVDNVRGAVRDALTLFDENAAWLQAPSALIDALQRRDWTELFVKRRALWSEARLELFGHALLEKLMQPRKSITSHVWVVPPDVADPSAWLAGQLSAEALAAKPWLPLPVLGVPGWWNSNEQPGFYDDASVFRPSRQNLKTGGPTA